MRKIKFRGRDFAGLWHIGDLIHNDDDLLIRNGCLSTYIENETAGQFTGITDKNGKDIYEGDIIQSFFTKRCYVVFWSDTELSFMYKNPKSSNVFALSKPDLTMYSIVGNIHDNPELLKGGNDE